MKDELLFLVDEDTAAFNKVMAAFGLPKDSAEEKADAFQPRSSRRTSMRRRFRFGSMETAAKSYELLAEMAEREILPRFQMSASVCSRRAPVLKARR